MEFHGDPGTSGPLSSDQTSWGSWTCILSFLAHSSALFVFSTGKGTHSLAPAKRVLYCWAPPPASGTFIRSADPRPSLDKGVDQETLPSMGWGGGGWMQWEAAWRLSVIKELTIEKERTVQKSCSHTGRRWWGERDWVKLFLDLQPLYPKRKSQAVHFLVFPQRNVNFSPTSSWLNTWNL